MRLKDDEQPAAGGTGGGDHRGDLGGVMAVVVDHHDAPAFTAHLESPLGAGEFREGGGNARERDLELDADRHGAERIEQVVPARHGDGHLAERLAHAVHQAADGAARGERLELHVVCGDIGLARMPRLRQPISDHAPAGPGNQRTHRLVVCAEDRGAVERHLVDELQEGVVQRLPAAVSVHVLAVDVGHERDRRRERQERTVAFVGLHDHRRAPAQAGVASEGAEPAADHRRRIEPGPLEHQRHHRGGGGLAVRAGDRDAVAKPHQLREHFRARDHRDAPPPRLQQLGIVLTDRRRHHDHVGGADMRGVVPGVHEHTEL